MKNIFWVALLGTIAFTACDDGGTTTSDTKDTATHDATGNHTTPATATDNNTTSSANAASLMDIMSKNMQDMKGMQSTGNPDNDFAAMMKLHHMGAIELAQAEVIQGTDPEIKQLAQKMLDDQQREVAELNSFLSGHNAHGGGDAFHKEVMSMMNDMSMNMDHSGSIDKQFAQMMIPHHQSAIDMSKAYIKQGAHEEKMKTMAADIIAAQQKEIQDLQAWLNKNK